jgi:hypothetical protein
MGGRGRVRRGGGWGELGVVAVVEWGWMPSWLRLAYYICLVYMDGRKLFWSKDLKVVVVDEEEAS